MGFRTADQFLAGLRDACDVYYRGERVYSVPDHPDLGVVARYVPIDFKLAEDPGLGGLARHEEDGQEFSACYRIPRNADDLAARSRLIEAATAGGATLVVLIKEIGTDALFAL
jgi:4-hydroxybutyryl-CoA dehydratase/vinylacetyl-CoA-Delta-isomerase